MYNGRVEGIFEDEGSFDIESDIIPFLSTLKGFKFGFNSGIRAEVLFINTKEFTVKWGTKNAINIPAPQLNLPGGMPIRAFGTFNCKVSDRQALIDKVAGVKQIFTIDDIRDRVISMLDQLLMKWITKEGKDMFNLQANAYDIAKGLQTDLDMEIYKIGIAITGLQISSFSYPEEIQAMQKKAASQSMIGDMNRYQQVAMADAMAKGNNAGGNMAANMAGMQMGVMMGQQMVNSMTTAINNNANGGMNNNMNNGMNTNGGVNGTVNNGQQNNIAEGPKFCPNCGMAATGSNFCSNCGYKLK